MVFCNVWNIILRPQRDGSHNPYFNRWFSAIDKMIYINENQEQVTILILIDGFLQSIGWISLFIDRKKSQSLF